MLLPLRLCLWMGTAVGTKNHQFNEIAYAPHLEMQHVNVIGSKVFVTYRDVELENRPAM